MICHHISSVARRCCFLSTNLRFFTSFQQCKMTAIGKSVTPAKRSRGPRTAGKNKHIEKKRFKAQQSGSIDHVIEIEVEEFKRKHGIPADIPEIERFSEVVVEIKEMLASGDGIGCTEDKNYAAVVHFTVPGDTVRAKVYKVESTHYLCESVEILKKSPIRRDDLIRCKYFGVCSGCQLQMLSMEDQLSHKRKVVENAYARLLLPVGVLPPIGDTIPSPIQYHYRTKITPHFDTPKSGIKQGSGEGLDIGFVEKGRRRILDIEECPISTEIINQTLPQERKRVKDNIKQYTRGATLLLRESLTEGSFSQEEDNNDTKVCITDARMTIFEKVGEFKFKFLAGEFFQNNNSILPKLTDHVKYLLSKVPEGQLENLVDAYCGSGLFSVCLSSLFKEVSGIEISQIAINAAKENANLNGITNIKFKAGSAEDIFKSIGYTSSTTAVIIDPPRKGCDTLFLDQLLKFKPRTIVYVSCNVHTQARDVKYLYEKGAFAVQDIRGIDLFPQTHHVESVALLTQISE